MASYYLDSSALVRRYRRDEPGAARVATLCKPSSRHLIVIARITPVEMASAFDRALRAARLDEPTLRREWRAFQRHAELQYRVIDADESVLDRAANLVFRQHLRAYDAVQLATALHVRAVAGLVTDFRFCTADQRQAEAADREGLNVELIA